VDAETLAAAMKRLFDDPAQRRAMSDAARRRGRPDAAASIVDDMESWLDAGASQGASTPGEGKREVGHLSTVENPLDVADDDSKSAPLLDVGEALQASATSPFGRVDFQSGRRMRMTRSVPALRVVPFEATLTLSSRPS
jgi:hypothetical protein